MLLEFQNGGDAKAEAVQLTRTGDRSEFLESCRQECETEGAGVFEDGIQFEASGVALQDVAYRLSNCLTPGSDP